MKSKYYLSAIFTLVAIQGFGQSPIDLDANKKTKYLLQNIRILSEKGFMIGHQDDQAYGLGWRAVDGRSDIKESVGKYPAVHGWDLGKKLDSDMNIDSVNYEDMKRWVRAAYKRGGINTVSFHMDNLTTGSDSWDKTPSVVDILPGGVKHSEFNQQLDLLSDFFKDLKNIPIVFRPWHEHNGNWFWWGQGNCTEEEYVQLFRYTVDYLRNTKGVHHLLYAFSPDRSRWELGNNIEENYLYGYPGDDYVDILGVDNYGDVGRKGGGNSTEEQKKYFLSSLKSLSKIADEKGKVAALTETGLEGVTKPNWFTDIILNPIKENREDIKIAWVLVWRNANITHHYAPYPGHVSVEDFKKFEEDELTFFESDLAKKIYKKPKK